MDFEEGAPTNPELQTNQNSCRLKIVSNYSIRVTIIDGKEPLTHFFSNKVPAELGGILATINLMCKV